MLTLDITYDRDYIYKYGVVIFLWSKISKPYKTKGIDGGYCGPLNTKGEVIRMFKKMIKRLIAYMKRTPEDRENWIKKHEAARDKWIEKTTIGADNAERFL